jgi:D-aminopeptidase
LFQATVEATEEAILNALLQATTVTGRDRRRFEAISIEKLRLILDADRTPNQ